MVGISNHYLIEILNRCQLKYWQGVFSSDTLPNKLHALKDYAVIVNFARENQVGTHFIALAKINHKLFLFDSLATPSTLLPATLREWMESEHGTFVFKQPIQHALSEFCGMYCLYFILWLSLPTSSRQHRFSPLKFSSSNTKLNDKICVDMIYAMLTTGEIKRRQ